MIVLISYSCMAKWIVKKKMTKRKKKLREINIIHCNQWFHEKTISISENYNFSFTKESLLSRQCGKTSYLLSRFFAKFAEKFRQIEAYPLQALIYYIKSLQKNWNYTFLRKFAQEFHITNNRGGY